PITIQGICSWMDHFPSDETPTIALSLSCQTSMGLLLVQRFFPSLLSSSLLLSFSLSFFLFLFLCFPVSLLLHLFSLPFISLTLFSLLFTTLDRIQERT